MHAGFWTTTTAISVPLFLCLVQLIAISGAISTYMRALTTSARLGRDCESRLWPLDLLGEREKPDATIKRALEPISRVSMAYFQSLVHSVVSRDSCHLYIVQIFLIRYHQHHLHHRRRHVARKTMAVGATGGRIVIDLLACALSVNSVKV